MLRYVALVAPMLLAAGAIGVTAQHVPPPDETSVYAILSLGAPPPTVCSCIPNPFELPPYHAGWGYGSGPAVPFEDAPISDEDRRRNREWFAQEDLLVRRVTEEALSGNNPNASLAVVTHLGFRTAIFGADDVVDAESMKWLTLAAQQGHPEAFRILGHRNAAGHAVAQDYGEAAKWFDLGARLNDPISMTAIGFLRAAGRGASQDWAVAIRWWTYAENRSPLAARFLGDAYACGAGVAEDRARALATYKRIAEIEPSASIQLGHMYVRGCAPPDDKAAIAAFRRAADRGYPEAQIELSDLLLKGRGGEPKPMEAYYWARLAERRLPPGALKTRADESARAAAGLMSAVEIAAGDDRVKAVMEAGAKPVR
jgi:TPR repeat protein